MRGRFAAFTNKPLDGAEGWVLGVKIGALFLTALVVPKCIPSAHRPADPKQPHPEQTASVLAFNIVHYFAGAIAMTDHTLGQFAAAGAINRILAFARVSLVFPSPNHLLFRASSSHPWVEGVQIEKRKKTLTEAIGVLRTIKLFGWEKKIQEKVNKRREEELKVLSLFIMLVTQLIPVITMLATYTVAVLIMKTELTASKTSMIVLGKFVPS
ncbi:hypothetical protein EST38_g10628 [Candolleomyces aberdarensis]|uniref:ABC transmembrane type-1 domain-containing protein n=1 Tax=Candolleomyces aberdarensis TaxID=2316362 RepID=A0A4Q2DA72_9AGAR|nr:hypothetical protein EST38_g10628 [Candolleomyces aberdarensis]